MRNNCLLILCLCLLVEGIYAQNADKGKNVTKNSVSTAQKTNAALKEARFDPRKPQLSADQVKQVDNRIRREFLQYQFPATLEEYGKQEKRMTEITAFRTATSLRHMISHPDLEEVMKAAVKSPNQVLFLTGVFPSGKRGYFAVDLTQE